MSFFLIWCIMKNELYKTEKTIDIDIGDMTLSIFALTHQFDSSVYNYTDSHFHTAYEFQYAVSGHFSLLGETAEYKIDEGKFTIIPPGIFHCNTTKEAFTRCAFRFSITPNDKINKNFSEYCYYKRILDTIGGIDVMECPQIKTNIQRLLKENTQSEQSKHKVQIYAALLITDALEHISMYKMKKQPEQYSNEKTPLSVEDERIKFIIETCISTYFSTEETPEQIARALGMSKRNSARIIYRLMGENISEIITKQRMNMAKTLIVKTNKSLSSIAEAVGYKTYVAFFTAFKKYYNVPPTSFRE